MKIETKYDIGQEVWVKLFTEITLVTISYIDIYVKKNGVVKPFYWAVAASSEDSFFKYEENEIFPTKEELLKSL